MTSTTSDDSSPRPTDPLPPREHEWVDTAGQLRRVADTLASETLVAVDTESDSFHHYREKVCLIQMSTPAADFIIDPLALGDISVLNPLFADPAREWVMNGADYDVVCLKRDFGIHFGRIFDTVVAAQLLGYRATGLAAMLERHFGVKVSKTFQRDEWFRRPLTPAQLEYAITDTRYLIALRGILRASLEAAGRFSWAEEEFEVVKRREWSREPFSPDDFWRIKGVRELNAREQVILRELVIMRDRKASEADRPPFKIISEQVLLAIAKTKPTRPEALRRVRGMSPLMLRRLGDDLLAAVNAGLVAAETVLSAPPRGLRRRYDPGVGHRLDILKEWRNRKAAALSIDAGVLSPLACLQAVARERPKTLEDLYKIPDVSRWRAKEFGEEWIRLLEKAG